MTGNAQAAPELAFTTSPGKALRYWSAAAGRRMTATGTRTVLIRASSRDLRLRATAAVGE